MRDYNIFNHILQPLIGEELILGKAYRSPLPKRRDSSPSFFVKNINGQIKWRDFGYTAHGNKVEHLLMAIHGISYSEAEEIIATSEFPVSDNIPPSLIPADYKLLTDNLNYTELSWWEKYHVTLPTLTKYKVRGLRRIYKDNTLIYNSNRDPVAFTYFGETRQLWQTYQPYCEYRGGKKVMIRKGSFVLGYEQLPLTGQTLFIVSGLKDGMVLQSAVPAANFIAPSGEADIPTVKRLLPELRLRFRKIVSLVDPDSAGRKATWAFKDIGIPPAEFAYPNSKDDLADLSLKFGLNYIRNNLQV